MLKSRSPHGDPKDPAGSACRWKTSCVESQFGSQISAKEPIFA